MNTTPLPLASRVFVKDWNELAKIPPSETHYLIISPEKGNGWVKKKGSTKPGTYLTTHTFTVPLSRAPPACFNPAGSTCSSQTGP